MDKTTSKIILSSAVFGLALTAGAMSSSAFQGDYGRQGPNYTPEIHEAMTEVFENGDYNAWRELKGDGGRVTDLITEENFSKFVEMRKLGLEGNMEEADGKREELGLPERRGESRGKGNKRGGFHNRMMNGGFQDANGDGVCDNLDRGLQNS